ncbi:MULTISPECIES: Kelch repeat-containing protein [Halorussus]|uniref:Kelch repeat-containing protein n=1 Tax=Halorussus TaxID=1070314 RepID=UPI0020A1A2DD|nr:galactose oxidase [Halorussus vallis]USZ75473.1 galactose oxidase [Halorussus vallis]
MPSRRILLRALGASLLASAAGCSGSEFPAGDPAERGTTETRTTLEPPTTVAYEETTVMPSLTTTETPTSGTSAARATDATATTETPTTTAATATTDERAVRDGANGGSGGQSGGSGSFRDPEPTTTTTETTADPTTSTTPGTTSGRPPTSTTTTTTADPTTSTTPTPTPTTTPETSTTPPATTTLTPTTTETTTPTPTTTERPPDGDGAWSAEASLPAPQSDAGGGVVDGNIYYFGGIESGENLPAVARTYRFDPTAGGETDGGAWERLEDMPRALWAPCGVAAEGKVFSFGGAPRDAPYGTGEPPSDEIFVYEPGEGWRDLTAETGVRCPYPNWAMGGVYDPDSGLVYLVGGGTDVTDRESASDHGVGGERPGTYDESRVWTFDPAAEEVVDPDLARLPEARRWPTVALVEVGGELCLHAICGLFGVTGPTNQNLRLRLSSGEWETMTPAPRAGSYATTSDPVIDGTVYLTHGLFWEDSPSVDSYTAACHAYDPATDEFRTDLARPRRLRGGSVDAVVDDTLYVVGGHVKRYDRNGYHDCVTASESFAPPE